MRLLIVRHGLAMKKPDFAKSGRADELRPLIEKGLKQTRKVARSLKPVLSHVDIIASSPLVRAVQTAEILAQHWGHEIYELTDSMKPDAEPSEVWDYLSHHQGKNLIALVGHEPHISALVTWLIAKDEAPFLEFKKSGAALLQVTDFKTRSVFLRWMIEPGLFRKN